MLQFSFVMSFDDFCSANDLPRYTKEPTPERPAGTPNGPSLAAWREASREAHEAIRETFDPLVHYTDGFRRVERRFLTQAESATALTALAR